MAAVTSSGGGGGAGALELICNRRIEFHLARKPYSAASSSSDNGFYLETLNPSVGNQKRPHEVAFGAETTSNAQGKRVEVGAEFFEHGLDQELGFRITFRRIGAGLANLGNTCFLNSVLQCLTYTEPFAAYLQSGKHKTSCRAAGFCALCALQNHVMNALQSTGKILSPLHLVRNLRAISRNFRNSRQEDAHEYMVNLLESMHKCCLPSGVPSVSPSAYEKSLVHKIFGGRLRSQVKCTQCQFCSNKYDPFLDLSLEIVRAETLRKALLNFTAVEKLDGGEKQYQCQRCKQKVRALKQLTIHKPPNVLTVHLKRFSAYIPGQKIDKKVEFEPVLDLKPFVSDLNEGNLKYILYGVLVHAGWSTHSGHYYCFVRTSSGMWHSLDDNQVRQVNEKTVLAQKAYMLFYVRDRGPVKNSVGPIQKPIGGYNTHGNQNNQHPTTPLNGANASFHPTEISKVNSDPKASSSHIPIIQNGNLLPVQKRSDLQSKGNSGPATSKDTATKDPVLVSLIKEPSAVINMTDKCSGNVLDVLDERPSKFENVGMHIVESQKVMEEGSNAIKDVGALVKHEHTQGDGSNGVNAVAKPESLENAINSDATSTKPEVVGTASNGVVVSEIRGINDITSKEPERNQKNLPKVSTVPKDDKQEPSEEKASTDDGEPLNQSPLCPTASMTKSVEKQIRDNLESKSRKRLKHQAKIACLARNMLFIRTLRMQKNLKFNKAQKQRLASFEALDMRTGDQASTSAYSNDHAVIKEQNSHKRKRPKSSKTKNREDLPATSVLKENLKSINSELAHANTDQPKTNQAVHLPANNIVIKESEGSKRCESYSFLMQGLKETTVPSWDDVELPIVKMQDAEPSKPKSIGYVLNEWDEEYDRGRRKKVKQSRVDFGGPNPFQETADLNAQQKMGKLNTGSVRSGNKPFRN